MAESEEELKSLLIRVKEESEKVGLKLNIQKMRNMASGPITSWQIEGKKWKQWQILFFGVPKSLWTVTAAMKLRYACSLEEKLWQNLGSILKSRDITLPTKVCIVKAMVFPLVMYKYENWARKKTEHWKIDAFKLWWWEDSWESLGLQGDQTSQSYRKLTLNIYWKNWCWSWSSSTLATWCEELTHKKRPWHWERLRAREGGDRG